MIKKRIVISGGGSGGHIYPGIAIAQALEKQDPSIEIHFVGARRGMEAQIIPKAGYPLHCLRVGRLNKNVSKIERIITLITLPIAFLQCLLLLIKLRPKYVLGVGGFASGPFLLIASLCGFKTAIWEPNAFPGLANRLLAPFVRRAFVVFKESAEFFSSEKEIGRAHV